jgi:ADP-heptose:LPS heptosyltransferase
LNLQNNEPLIWSPNRAPIKKPAKPKVSNTSFRNLGLDVDVRKKHNTIEELRNSVMGIVVAKCLKNISFSQNWSREQSLKKGNHYVMGLGVYRQLEYQNKNIRILGPGNIKFNNIYRPYLGEDLTDKTLLVSRTGGIGDLLFIQPNLRYLKQKYPSCTIKFSCGPQYRSMVETWDCIDIHLDLPFHVSHMYNSYHGFFEGVIERCKQAETENAYNLFSKWLGLNLPDELLVPIQTPSKIRLDECRKILTEWNLEEKGFLLLQPRASSPIRSPSPTFFLNLTNRLTNLGYKIVITDMFKYSSEVERFIAAAQNKNQLFNFAKYPVDLDCTIAMASLSKLVMSTDSALSHIAQSVGVPLFGIYGPFPGFIRLKTYKNVDWIDAKMHCTPCFLHGQELCPTARAMNKNFSPCYENINQQEMIDKIERLIDG